MVLDISPVIDNIRSKENRSRKYCSLDHSRLLFPNDVEMRSNVVRLDLSRIPYLYDTFIIKRAFPLFVFLYSLKQFDSQAS